MECLGELAGDAVTRRKTWPSTPQSLGGELRRIAPNLRAAGVSVDFERIAGGKRRIRIGPDSVVTPVTVVTNRSTEPKSGDGSDQRR